MEDIIQKIFSTCEKITGNLPDTIDSLKAELKSFISLNGGGDFIIDDLRSLFEISVIYSEKDVVKIMDKDFYDYLDVFLNNKDIQKDKKVALINKENKNIVEEIAERVIEIHNDLDYKISGTCVSFFNMKGYLFSYYDIYTLKGADELIGTVKFYKVKAKSQLFPLLDNKLIMKKTWKASKDRTCLIGQDITVNELCEMILNRKIINYANA